MKTTKEEEGEEQKIKKNRKRKQKDNVSTLPSELTPESRHSMGDCNLRRVNISKHGSLVLEAPGARKKRRETRRWKHSALGSGELEKLNPRGKCQSDMKIGKTRRWSSGETETFYEGLRMYGTDFGRIEVLLPRKSRMQVKRKYLKELKDKKEDVDQAVMGSTN